MTRIAITGASTGLGAALARQMAGPGVSLALCARRIGPLENLVEALHGQGAEVTCDAVDVSNGAEVTAWCDALWRAGPVDRLILNAGVFDGRGPDGRQETAAQSARLISTNLIGATGPALQVAEKMRDRGAGEIVFISSLAAFSPLADAPSYAASKAGVTIFARALREDLGPAGVRVVVVHPGHIATAQTDQHQGALPGLVTADEAARIILKGLARGRAEIDFPVHVRLGLRLQALLPGRIQARINRPLRFRARPKEDGDD